MNHDIYYLDLYNGDKKVRNVGFVRFCRHMAMITLIWPTGAYRPSISIHVVYTDGKESVVNEVNRDEKLSGNKQTAYNCNVGVSKEQISQIYIKLDRANIAKCFVNEQVIKKSETISSCKSDTKQSVPREINVIAPVEADKWNQLCKTYTQIHIFPEAQTVLISPEDMVILTNQYHKLATNSFVLHAYYNYRQLLLFRYKEENNTLTYYLGVPGIYYERERRIALMFGFEAFENGESRLVDEKMREIYPGCFGYYMKKVDI